uniref:Anosmin-1 n=1 Tax=Ditylenchus dipsaci TaxID=166011 RepID=A0A915DEQ9_9BILA
MSIVADFVLLLLLLLFPCCSPSEESSTGSEDIVSARCQSKCLLELEQRHKCILPCRESLFDHQVCARTVCHETVDVANCQESCAFLQKVNQRKPGSCPKKTLVSNLECSAMCDQDGDCPETDKCCTSGCSRKCVAPVLHDQRLLPIPDGITIQERKRKRSAIVRWIMKRMSPQHTSTNSNLFVIQWRWSIHKHEDTMTPWQTIMVRNKMYAIFKHLLSPGRYYTFRVAAVNVHGSYGFSKASYPLFKLSKEVKAPSSPTNLTLETTKFDEEASSWTSWIRWTPPYSDLPLKDYQLSWWKTTAALASAYQDRQLKSSLAQQLQSKRSASDIITQPQHLDDEFTDSDYNDNKHLSPKQDIFQERRSIVLPSYSTQAELVGWTRGMSTWLRRVAREPAVLFIWTNTSLSSAPPSSSTPALRDVEEEWQPLVPDQPIYHIYSLPIDEPPAAAVLPTTSLPSLTTLPSLELTKFRAEVKPPYFDKGYLKSSVSWLDHPLCSSARSSQQQQLFRVYISTLQCINQLPPQQFQVAHCVANLDNLQFNCNYFVEIEAIDTPSEIPLQCSSKKLLSTPPPTSSPVEGVKKITSTTTMTIPTNIASSSERMYLGRREKAKCLVTSSTSAKCGWRDMNYDMNSATSSGIIGYRTILTSTDHVYSNVSILRPDVREVDWSDLSQQQYTFRVQPISTHGLGTQLELNFNTKEGWRKHPTTPPPIIFEHYGDSVELPLEASRASNVIVYTGVLRILALMLCFRFMD